VVNLQDAVDILADAYEALLSGLRGLEIRDLLFEGGGLTAYDLSS
jgi:hypothetical protein